MHLYLKSCGIYSPTQNKNVPAGSKCHPKNTDTLSLRLIHEVIVLLYLLIRPIRSNLQPVIQLLAARLPKTRNTNQLVIDHNLVLKVLC